MKTDYIFDYNDGIFAVNYNETKGINYEIYDENWEKVNYGYMLITKDSTFKIFDEIFDSYQDVEDDVLRDKIISYLQLNRHIYTDIAIQ